MSHSRFSSGNPAAQTPKRPNESSAENLDAPSRLQRQSLHVRLPRQLLRKLKIFCTASGVDLQDAVSEGIELYLFRQVEAGNPAAQTPVMIDHDDLKKKDEDVITISSNHFSEAGNPAAQRREFNLLGFYAEQTGNRLKERDRTAFKEIAHCSDNAIKAGILKSIIFCDPQVHSFRYCQGAIREINEKGVVPDDYVRYIASKVPIRQQYRRQPNLPGVGGDVVDLPKKGK